MNFTLHARDGAARRATLQTARGAVETPTFMPVGTAATVKGLTPNEVRDAHSQIILANTYHLWLRPGRQVLLDAGG
ncbi:MAG: tRNA-guanine transglycosylase, partial [Candidatus Eremiobacteraeota bacterium]|nr:tRNA-guanine transglycosylase [Candidatus Eremiobacteraeota bacterium]